MSNLVLALLDGHIDDSLAAPSMTMLLAALCDPVIRDTVSVSVLCAVCWPMSQRR